MCVECYDANDFLLSSPLHIFASSLHVPLVSKHSTPFKDSDVAHLPPKLTRTWTEKCSFLVSVTRVHLQSELALLFIYSCI